MNLFRISTSLILLALLTGCATYGTEQRAAVAAAHPEWSEQTRQDVAGGSIRVGMTKEQVRAAWGDPCIYCHGTRSTSAGDWWEYNALWPHRWHIGAGTHLFFGNDGKLKFWSGR